MDYRVFFLSLQLHTSRATFKKKGKVVSFLFVSMLNITAEQLLGSQDKQNCGDRGVGGPGGARAPPPIFLKL